MASIFFERLRKPLAAVGLGVRSSATQVDASVPQIISGAGVPTAALPDGSFYLRTDPSDADTVLYARVSSSWVAMLGAS